MADIKQFFITKLAELLPCEKGIPPVIGSLTLAASFHDDNGKADASQYYLHDRQSDRPSGKNKPQISILNKPVSTVFTSRIKKTPFYLSYLSAENFVVYLLDFYCWSPHTILYRLFHVEYHNENQPFLCRFPLAGDTGGKGSVSYDGLQISWYTGAPSVWTGETLNISPPASSCSSLDLAIAISGQRPEPGSLSADKLLKAYLELEIRARSAHISHYLKTQNPAIDRMLDNAWARIKGLTPEGQLDQSAQMLENKNDRRGWTVEIGKILGLDMPPEAQTLLSILPEKEGEQDDFYQMISRAYLYDDPPADPLIERLQSWWNRYSLPVFEKKFQVLLKDRSEILFMVYALAERYRMSWSKDLLIRCLYFKDEPELHLLTALHSLLYIHIEKGRVGGVHRGSRQAGNLLSLKRPPYTFRYTAFGCQQFSEIRLENRQLCKIDKEVDFLFSENTLHIRPALLSLHAQAWQQNILEIKVNETLLLVPLVWRQTRLDFEDLRIRWLLKKDRFQFTCKAGKSVHSLQINGETIDVDHVRLIKKYVPVKKSAVLSGILLLNGEGRTLHLRKQQALQKIMIFGWILDQHGVFPSHVNVIEGKKQTICKIDESGKVEQSIFLKSRPAQLELVIKKHRESHNLFWIEEQALSGFLCFAPEESPGTLLVLISEALKKDLEWIKTQLKEALGYLPALEVLSKNKIPTFPGPVLYLQGRKEKHPPAGKQIKPLVVKTDRMRKDLFAEILPEDKKQAKN